VTDGGGDSEDLSRKTGARPGAVDVDKSLLDGSSLGGMI